jgi:ornithine carbamoyltransferase
VANHLISITDLTRADLLSIVDKGTRCAAGDIGRRPLDGRVVGIYFRKTSTRTRTSFSSAALRLGGQIIAYGPNDLQTNTGETIEDTGRVLAGMLDALVARTSGETAELRTLAAQDSMAVINAMSAAEHPTQAITDLITMRVYFGQLDGLSVLYVGEGNNTASALALAITQIPGAHLHLRTPPGYGLDSAIAAQAGPNVTEHHDMLDLPSDVDVIYTTRWQTTGTVKPDPDWRNVFAPFQVTAELWNDHPKAVFMHDLPAHRGDEVTAEVLDGPASIAFQQAHHKLHAAMAVLDWSLAQGERTT